MMSRQTNNSKKFSRTKPLIALGVLSSFLLPSLAFGITFNVTDGSDGADLDINGNCGACTLRAAIQEANANPGVDTISLGTTNVILNISGVHENDGAQGDLDITDDLIIQGSNGSVRNIINGRGLDRVFHISGGANVTMSNIKIAGGRVDASTTPSDGQADGGAGIYVQNGYLELQNVEISDNRLSAVDPTFQTAGGGIYVGENGTLLIDNSVIKLNWGPAGGALTNLGTATILNTLIEDNEAIGQNSYGGAIGNMGGYLNIGNTTITSNKAKQGGAIYNTGLGLNLGNVIITNTNIEANRVGRFGGGIFNLGPMTITNSSINENESDFDGAGIYNLGLGNIDIINSTISSNNGRSGGGIYNTRSISLTSSTVYNNRANPTSECIDTNGDGIDDCAKDIGSGKAGGNQITVFASSDAGSPSLTLSNTIVANGNNSIGSKICSGSDNYRDFVVTSGHNLENGDTCGLKNDTTYFDQTNVANVLLGDLTTDVNHPDTTPVHPLLSNSPAINTGDLNTCPLVDQRFLKRSDGSCDIGAYEFEATVPLRDDLVDLKVTIKDSANTAVPNDPNSLLSYTISVTNLYLKKAFGITVVIELPVSFTFVNISTATSGDSIDCDGVPNASNELECTMTQFEALGRADISVSGIPTAEGTIVTNATVIFANEAFSPNNFASEETTISATANTTDNFGGTSNSGGSGGGGSLSTLFLLLFSGLFLRLRYRY
ncbi:choice-of-anchor Q domain-containing protein [Pseudomonadota bacterium]